jgi:hypothetical protein
LVDTALEREATLVIATFIALLTAILFGVRLITGAG